MRISTFFYTIKQGIVNIWKNKLFSLASIATMTACIFLFGLFYMIVVNFQSMVKDAESGVLRQDYDKCIGCRMCMAACPYNARSFNWEEPVRDVDFNYGDAEVPVRPRGVAEKCTLCRERTDRGEEPMCVVCCPTHARIFGDLDDPASEVSKAVVERKAHALLEEQGTRPQVYYFD